MPANAPILSRLDLLRRLPLHVGLAALCGAIAGPLVYLLLSIPLAAPWNLTLLVPTGALYVNGATLPVALPGRHWTFAFVGAVALYFLLIVGVILSVKLPFPHSATGAGVLRMVNVITAGGIVTGVCVGLFYGLLMGRRAAMVWGGLLGGAAGYLIGLLSVQFVTAQDALRYDGAAHWAWQFALGLVLLHLAGGIGATIGFGAPIGRPAKAR